MIISWLGEAGIRLQIKDTIVLIDPPAAKTGFKPTRQTVNVVALTQADLRDASGVGGQPFTVDQPGEYEVQNVFLYGLRLPSEAGRVHFRLEAEDMSLGHLADLNHKLDNGELAELEGVDILFVPIGGKRVLDAEAAAEVISQVEPRLIVPIQYRVAGSTLGYDPVQPFLKEMGSKTSEPQAKLKVAKKDLPAEDSQVVVLSVD